MTGSEERRGISLHGFLLPLFPFRPSRENSPSWTNSGGNEEIWTVDFLRGREPWVEKPYLSRNLAGSIFDQSLRSYIWNWNALSQANYFDRTSNESHHFVSLNRYFYRYGVRGRIWMCIALTRNLKNGAGHCSPISERNILFLSFRLFEMTNQTAFLCEGIILGNPRRDREFWTPPSSKLVLFHFALRTIFILLYNYWWL